MFSNVPTCHQIPDGAYAYTTAAGIVVDHLEMTTTGTARIWRIYKKGSPHSLEAADMASFHALARALHMRPVP